MRRGQKKIYKCRYARRVITLSVLLVGGAAVTRGYVLISGMVCG